MPTMSPSSTPEKGPCRPSAPRTTRPPSRCCRRPSAGSWRPSSPWPASSSASRRSPCSWCGGWRPRQPRREGRRDGRRTRRRQSETRTTRFGFTTRVRGFGHLLVSTSNKFEDHSTFEVVNKLPRKSSLNLLPLFTVGIASVFVDFLHSLILALEGIMMPREG